MTLIENTTCRDDLACEHGLSLYMEVNGLRLLFDAGQTDAFAENAARLCIDLGLVDACILSHGHYDHGGGLARFLAINNHAPVYVHRDAFGAHWHGPAKYIGLDGSLACSDRIRFVSGETILAPGAVLHTALPCREPIRPYGLTRLADGRHHPEDFRHEQYLLLEENGRRILISGCSHRGILNIAEHFAPDVLIGGFHLMKETDPLRLDEIAARLMALPTVYYTGHCTGDGAFAHLKAFMGERLHGLHTGSVFQIAAAAPGPII